MENGFLPVYGMTFVMRPQRDISSQLEIYPIIDGDILVFLVYSIIPSSRNEVCTGTTL